MQLQYELAGACRICSIFRLNSANRQFIDHLLAVSYLHKPLDVSDDFFRLRGELSTLE